MKVKKGPCMNTLDKFSTKEKDENYTDNCNWIFEILTTDT